MGTVRIGSKHCRAICDEIGERLRQHIDSTTTSPPHRILELLREFEMQELQTPSIVPSLEDMEALVSNPAVE